MNVTLLVNNDGPEPMKLKPLYQWLIVLGVWSPFAIAVASSLL
jgi:hypothetical protein